jgi:hypothetical protein
MYLALSVVFQLAKSRVIAYVKKTEMTESSIVTSDGEVVSTASMEGNGALVVFKDMFEETFDVLNSKVIVLVADFVVPVPIVDSRDVESKPLIQANQDKYV